MRAGAAAVAVGLCLASPVPAQVLEVRPDGSTATYQGPGVFSDQGFDPIATPVAASTKARPAPASASERQAVAQALSAASGRHRLSPALVHAVAWQESRLNPRAVSEKGALGAMQLMPATARALGVDPRDPAANANGGAAYLAQLLSRFDGDLRLTLAAYNAGPAAVLRYGGVPPFAETRAYVDAVLDRLALQATASRQRVP